LNSGVYNTNAVCYCELFSSKVFENSEAKTRRLRCSLSFRQDSL